MDQALSVELFSFSKMPVINNLSPEILSYIFTFCVDKVDGHFIIPSPKTAPLLLIQICRYWTQVAVGTSELWKSISLHRHARFPYGYNFVRDGERLADWIGRASIRNVAVDLSYDQLSRFKDILMWNDLIVIVLALLHPDIKCDRLHLDLPDDCMEKVFWKLDASDLTCANTRALSLKSSKVKFCRMRYRRWYDFGNPNLNVDASRPYQMDFNLEKFPALEELTISFPAPYTICNTALQLTKLDIVLYYWKTFESCVDLMPNLVEVKVTLNVDLAMDTPLTGNSPLEATNVRKLEICSEFDGQVGSEGFRSFFLAFRFPQLHTFAVRYGKVPHSEDGVSSIALPLTGFVRNHGTIENFALVNFPIPELEIERFTNLFSLIPRVKHIELRNEAKNILPCIGSALCWSERRPICPELCSLKIHSNIRYERERERSITRLAQMLISRRPEEPSSCGGKSAKKSKLIHRLDHLQLSRHLVDSLERTVYGNALKENGLKITTIRWPEARLTNY